MQDHYPHLSLCMLIISFRRRPSKHLSLASFRLVIARSWPRCEGFSPSVCDDCLRLVIAWTTPHTHVVSPQVLDVSNPVYRELDKAGASSTDYLAAPMHPLFVLI